ncbi:glycoside hydrolase family 3 protein [Brevundimonas sp. S30B]|uniref:glycoside hydrolase family 3 protein n=1 Tax=unclassified Brevundimonas TaxID=2622653 RepID=UPI0010724BFA|nr:MULTISPECIES: exo 1,3/1,4-beta-D-glucan glucohydrolase [unclassified Brevundimonas]QBX37696.1 glycoside hydrolase family 3 protein [Brevundimonas sp. MF30-B]TFW00560.1 glycoside hydrolase family 3 protein [Brevundimonas sp. S30B]
MFLQRPAVISALALTVALGGCATAAEPAETPAQARATPSLWPQAASPDALTDAQTEAFIDTLIARMTLEEKVGQIIQADIASITPQDLATYPIGSILAGGNSSPGGNERAPLAEWVALSRAFRQAAEARPGAAVPLMFGIDAVHGHNNIVGATLFPHNIGLGAARDPDLIRRIGEATALEVVASGADWTFGPTLAVPRNDRWGRTYEGYGEDPEIVKAYAGPMTLGLQGALQAGRPLAADRIAGSAKHFLADGGTTDGVDQGDAVISEAELIGVHAQGYVPAIDEGVLTVMASFSSWNGVKITGNRSLLTDVLKERMGFDGFVVGDWNAHGQIPGCSNESCPQAINAGLDMFMAPDSWRGLYDNTLAQARAGEIPAARLDDAVRRILRVKAKLGVFDRDRSYEGRAELLGSADHRELAREAVRKSLVLLKNEGVLPIRPGARVLVAGEAADSIGQASGGWTITWQGTDTTNADFPGGTSIWAGLRDAVSEAGGSAELSASGEFTQKPDVAIVVFGETPYAEFQGDIQTLEFLPEGPLEMLRRLKAQGIPTVSVFLSGRPLWTNPEINASDAFVAAWLPGTEGAGVADVLVAGRDGATRHDFTGRLSFSWPKTAAQDVLNVGDPGYDPQFAYGYGLSYSRPAAVAALGEDPGVEITRSNLDRYFADGRVQAPWSLLLRDGGGDTRVGQVLGGSSPRGAVSVRSTDGTAQESAMALSFSGPGEAVIFGPAVDLSRQRNGDMVLALSVRLDEAARGPIDLGFGAEHHDIAPLLADAAVGQWRHLRLRLACFDGDAAGVSAVETPFSLRSAEPLRISLADISLTSNDAPAVCLSETSREALS